MCKFSWKIKMIEVHSQLYISINDRGTKSLGWKMVGGGISGKNTGIHSSEEKHPFKAFCLFCMCVDAHMPY